MVRNITLALTYRDTLRHEDVQVGRHIEADRTRAVAVALLTDIVPSSLITPRREHLRALPLPLVLHLTTMARVARTRRMDGSQNMTATCS